jgi:hypothetical protein
MVALTSRKSGEKDQGHRSQVVGGESKRNSSHLPVKGKTDSRILFMIVFVKATFFQPHGPSQGNDNRQRCQLPLESKKAASGLSR